MTKLAEKGSDDGMRIAESMLITAGQELDGKRTEYAVPFFISFAATIAGSTGTIIGDHVARTGSMEAGHGFLNVMVEAIVGGYVSKLEELLEDPDLAEQHAEITTLLEEWKEALA